VRIFFRLPPKSLLGLFVKISKLIVFVAFAASVTFGIRSAPAADLAVKAMPYAAPAPAFSWTGFYVGANAGYAWGTNQISGDLGGAWVNYQGVPGAIDPDNAGVTSAARRTLNSSSFTGGAQLGYNHQINGFVIGLEADANYLGLRKSYTIGPLLGAQGPGTYSVAAASTADALFTLRPRVGIAIDRSLVYITGGLAASTFAFSQNISYLNPRFNFLPFTPAGGGANAGSASSTKVGWTIGAGFERMLDNNWSVKAEYLYVDFGAQSFSSSYTDLQPAVFTVQHRDSLTTNIVRLGVNYHFGGGPVVAKY
jgi:outer membrane immunogenic protein